MEIYTTVACPFCGQACALPVDTTLAQQRWTTDCEICCRPFEILAECEPGRLLRLEVEI